MGEVLSMAVYIGPVGRIESKMMRFMCMWR